jgi:hypothetical protein
MIILKINVLNHKSQNIKVPGKMNTLNGFTVFDTIF